jgi:hypothetical protein
MYHSDKGDVLGLHPFHYVWLKGSKRRELTFYAESQAEADKSARAWCTPRDKLYRVKGRKSAARKS